MMATSDRRFVSGMTKRGDAELAVRRAAPHDAYALWIWANDSGTRTASHARAVIEWRAHVEWLDTRARDANSLVLIAETLEGRPVGSVRFASEDEWKVARLSYVVAPEARGQGLSRSMVRAALSVLESEHEPESVVAEVLSTNEASLRVFRGLGWTEREKAGDIVLFTFP